MGKPEAVIFQDKSVTITTARAVLGDTTYAMGNITSVRSFKEKPAFGCLLLFALPCFAIGSVGLKNNWDYGWIFLVAAIVVLGVALATQRTKHWVRIGTAGAETNAVWSHNAAWTKSVVDAVNQAIVARG